MVTREIAVFEQQVLEASTSASTVEAVVFGNLSGEWGTNRVVTVVTPHSKRSCSDCLAAG